MTTQATAEAMPLKSIWLVWGAVGALEDKNDRIVKDLSYKRMF